MSNKSLKRSFTPSSLHKDFVPKKIQKLTPRKTAFRNRQEAELFNFKQIQKICSQVLQAKNDDLQKEYEISLKTKLAEQYDTFVKFTYDQILKRSEDDVKSSYLS